MDDPERCCGEGGGRGVHVWERMSELKILKFKKNIKNKKKMDGVKMSYFSYWLNHLYKSLFLYPFIAQCTF